MKNWAVKKLQSITPGRIRAIWYAVKSFLDFHGVEVKGGFPYVGKISFLYPFEEAAEQIDEATGIAERVLGKDPRDGKTWSYLIFIYDIREVKIPLEKFNEVTGYKFEAKPGKAVIRSIIVRVSRKSNPFTLRKGESQLIKIKLLLKDSQDGKYIAEIKLLLETEA
jgi:hypothetical protein